MDQLLILMFSLPQGLIEDACTLKSCKHHAICKKGKCVCPKKEDCSPLSDHVCASDGNIYDNECLMKVESCKKGTTLVDVGMDKCSKSCYVIWHILMGLKTHLQVNLTFLTPWGTQAWFPCSLFRCQSCFISVASCPLICTFDRSLLVCQVSCQRTMRFEARRNNDV